MLLSQKPFFDFIYYTRFTFEIHLCSFFFPLLHRLNHFVKPEGWCNEHVSNRALGPLGNTRFFKVDHGKDAKKFMSAFTAALRNFFSMKPETNLKTPNEFYCSEFELDKRLPLKVSPALLS